MAWLLFFERKLNIQQFNTVTLHLHTPQLPIAKNLGWWVKRLLIAFKKDAGLGFSLCHWREFSLFRSSLSFKISSLVLGLISSVILRVAKAFGFGAAFALDDAFAVGTTGADGAGSAGRSEGS